MYCFDTDVLSFFGLPRPPLPLIRRASEVPISEHATTAISIGEIAYGLARRSDPRRSERMEAIVSAMSAILPFDERAARLYGTLRARLESAGRRLHEADLRIAGIALAHDVVLVTGNVKHFARIPDLRVENWLE